MPPGGGTRRQLVKPSAEAIDQVGGVAVGGGAVLSAASPEAIWPTAFVAAAYILGQAIVDTWGN